MAWYHLLGVSLLGMPAIHAGDLPPGPADVAYQEAVKKHFSDLEEVATNREAVIEEIVRMWFMNLPGWEEKFRSLLNLINDSKLLAILNTNSYAEV